MSSSLTRRALEGTYRASFTPVSRIAVAFSIAAGSSSASAFVSVNSEAFVSQSSFSLVD